MTAAAPRHPPLQPGWIDRPHAGLDLGDFRLENGETIRDFALSYVMHGKLNAARSNAVLVLCALGSTHHRLDFLIGSGRALDPGELCIICVDAIGNGLTSSPSLSRFQGGLAFPRFSIRDMVESQRRLIAEHFEIVQLAAVVGASMGGMQALQWGVSHPEVMRKIVAMTPMAKTSPWSATITHIGRSALMADPAWADGHNESGWAAWVPLMQLIAGRTPQALQEEFARLTDLRTWIADRVDLQHRMGLSAMDWVYQSWAYDAHDVGMTPGFDGDTVQALRTICAETLLLAPALDLFNPSDAAHAAAAAIPNARFASIDSHQGHQAVSSTRVEDARFLNRVIGDFLSGS